MEIRFVGAAIHALKQNKKTGWISETLWNPVLFGDRSLGPDQTVFRLLSKICAALDRCRDPLKIRGELR